jgi:hypothetical protein
MGFPLRETLVAARPSSWIALAIGRLVLLLIRLQAPRKGLPRTAAQTVGVAAIVGAASAFV